MIQKNQFRRVVVLRNAVCIIFTLVISLLTLRPAAASGQFYFLENENIGKPAKDFTLKTIGGADMSFSAFRKQDKAVVFFWATWCPHCRRELGNVNQMQGQLSQKGIKVALVDIGEDENTVRQYLQKNNIQATVFLDQDSSVAESYDVVGVPTFYLIGPDGVVRGVDHSLPENYEELLAAPAQK